DCGGQMFTEPMDVMEEGRMAVAADPTGAVFGVWQARNHHGAGAVNEPGALTWNECMTRDYDRARGFYADVFGYDVEEVGDGNFRYSVLNLDGRAVGGLGELGAEIPSEVPPHWMAYFDVADTDAAVQTVGELGGQVRVPPMDTPYGRIAVLEGAQGEIFAVIASGGSGSGDAGSGDAGG
ncbi:MAG: VOC family protein, partial [Nocardioidaceae bacterium]